jgi:hypothetical protein
MTPLFWKEERMCKAKEQRTDRQTKQEYGIQRKTKDCALISDITEYAELFHFAQRRKNKSKKEIYLTVK